jgi:ribosomal protein S18 acetylase RimI-like enzyme
MTVRSLGLQTHLMFARFDGQIIERPDCIVVRTPSNPTFYWGNFLIFPKPPTGFDDIKWIARFHEEIGALQSESKHIALAVDAPSPGKIPLAFKDLGFEFLENATLVLDSLPPAPAQAALDVQIRPIDYATELDALIALDMSDGGDGYEPVGYEIFRRKQHARYAAMARAGMGSWFGAWLGDQLVAGCGLFHEHRLGRFQYVMTHERFRGRGICTRLVFEAARTAFEQWHCERLVIEAEPGAAGHRVYRRVGFRLKESNWGMQLRTPADRKPPMLVQT